MVYCNYSESSDYQSYDKESDKDSNSDQNYSDESDESNNEVIMVYCITNAIYDNPGLIKNLFYRKTAQDSLSETFIRSNSDESSLSVDALNILNNLDFRPIVSSPSLAYREGIVEKDNFNLKGKYFIKSPTPLSYIDSLFKKIELGYLDPLSDDSRRLAQERHTLENIDFSITETTLNDYSAFTSILGGALLYFSTH